MTARNHSDTRSELFRHTERYAAVPTRITDRASRSLRLDIPLGTVKSRMTRAILALRSRLNPSEEQAPGTAHECFVPEEADALIAVVQAGFDFIGKP